MVRRDSAAGPAVTQSDAANAVSLACRSLLPISFS
jgi:hypothetical protein